MFIAGGTIYWAVQSFLNMTGLKFYGLNPSIEMAYIIGVVFIVVGLLVCGIQRKDNNSED